ncbi:hypothetical protein E9531_14525 [Lampropedia puyangensis]|uniref:Uncharacterized protein n=1 Tax=Lampropedia puyangensis TaxID=1330072 RepID=A0A4S8EX36_9BURK|nr:hypothetical protein [Lampropedia puyangensis]THT98424.1 hypothetical protein E9531_14525 [Lampropedia puyangensis]
MTRQNENAALAIFASIVIIIGAILIGVSRATSLSIPTVINVGVPSILVIALAIGALLYSPFTAEWIVPVVLACLAVCLFPALNEWSNSTIGRFEYQGQWFGENFAPAWYGTWWFKAMLVVGAPAISFAVLKWRNSY